MRGNTRGGKKAIQAQSAAKRDYASSHASPGKAGPGCSEDRRTAAKTFERVAGKYHALRRAGYLK